MKTLTIFLITQNISTFKSFSKKIYNLRKVKSRTVETKKRKPFVDNTAYKLFNKQIGQLDNEYNKLSNAEKNKFLSRYNISDLFLDDYDYIMWLVGVTTITRRKCATNFAAR